MASWKNGLGGAASGAAIGSTFGPWGTAIGAGLGGLVGLFGSDDSDAEAAAQQRLKLFQDLKDQYLGPDSASQQALARLEKLSETGLSDEDRAAAYHLLDQSNTMAKGREGAIEQEQQEQGRGVASSGLDAALREQASEAAAQRQTSGEMDIAATAEANRRAALSSYLDQKARNDQMLNSYKLAVASGESGALTNLQSLYEAENAATTGNLQHGIDTAGTAALYSRLGGKSAVPGSPAVPGLGLSLPNSGFSPGAGTSLTKAPAAGTSAIPGSTVAGAPAGSAYAAGAGAYLAGQTPPLQSSSFAAPPPVDPSKLYDLGPLADRQ